MDANLQLNYGDTLRDEPHIDVPSPPADKRVLLTAPRGPPIPLPTSPTSVGGAEQPPNIGKRRSSSPSPGARGRGPSHSGVIRRLRCGRWSGIYVDLLYTGLRERER